MKRFMKHELPILSGAGLFDSKICFPSLIVTSPRKVMTYELEYFYEEGGVSVINGKAYPIKSGNILIAKPGDIRYSHLPFTCHYLHFSVTDKQLIACLESMDTVSNITDKKKVHDLFSSIATYFYSVNPLDNITAAAQLILLLHFAGNHKTEEISAVGKAQKYIEYNFQEELTAESIAAACNISTSYLYKLFSTALDTTPGEYLLNCRICAARDLLANTTLSLNEIAFDCGFHSQSYFSDCFKKRVGISPREFRKQTAYRI